MISRIPDDMDSLAELWAKHAAAEQGGSASHSQVLLAQIRSQLGVELHQATQEGVAEGAQNGWRSGLALATIFWLGVIAVGAILR